MNGRLRSTPGFLAEALTWPGNQHYITALKTARSWGVPPLTILIGKEEEGWSKLNRMLAQALTVVEDETCKSCKTPLWLAYSTNNEIQFKVDSAFCYACSALEKHKEEHKKDAKPGEIVYVKPYNVFEDKPLPSRAESYAREG